MDRVRGGFWVVVIDLDLNWMEGLLTLIWLRVFMGKQRWWRYICGGGRWWWLEDGDGGAGAVLVQICCNLAIWIGPWA